MLSLLKKNHKYSPVVELMLTSYLDNSYRICGANGEGDGREGGDGCKGGNDGGVEGGGSEGGGRDGGGQGG